MFVCARLGRAPALPSSGTFVLALRLRLWLRRRQMDHLIVVVTVLEIFAVGKKVEQFEVFLLRLLHFFAQFLVKELFSEIVLASTAPLDLDEVSRGENRPE